MMQQTEGEQLLMQSDTTPQVCVIFARTKAILRNAARQRCAAAGARQILPRAAMAQRPQQQGEARQQHRRIALSRTFPLHALRYQFLEPRKAPHRGAAALRGSGRCVAAVQRGAGTEVSSSEE